LASARILDKMWVVVATGKNPLTITCQGCKSFLHPCELKGGLPSRRIEAGPCAVRQPAGGGLGRGGSTRGPLGGECVILKVPE